MNCFYKALLDISVSCQIWKDFIFKTVSTKLFIFMILNLYLTLQWSQSKEVLKYDFVVAVL